MKEPAYKPEQWIVFEQEEDGGFGQINGGIFNGEQWEYTVKGALVDGDLRAVAESEITYLLQNGSWLAPSHFGDRGSAYTEPSA